jgi:hypothetical protein
MFIYQTQYLSAMVLSRLAALAHAWARSVRAARKWLDSGLGRRRVTATAPRDFRRMSEPELRRIGLTRVDLRRVSRQHVIEYQCRM